MDNKGVSIKMVSDSFKDIYHPKREGIPTVQGRDESGSGTFEEHEGEKSIDQKTVEVNKDRLMIDLITDLSVSKNPHELVDVINKGLNRIVPFEIGSLSWRSGEVSLDDDYDPNNDYFSESMDFSPMQDIVVDRSLSGELQDRIPDLEERWRGEFKGSYRAHTSTGDNILVNLNSAFLAPLHHNGKRIGTLALFSFRENRKDPFTDRRLETIVKVLSSRLGDMIENRNVQNDIQRKDLLLDGCGIILISWRFRDSVWEVDFNRRAEEYINYIEETPETVEGAFFVPPGDGRDRANAAWDSAFHEGETTSIDVEILSESNRPRKVFCSFSPMKNGDDIIGVTMTGLEAERVDSTFNDLSRLNECYRLTISILTHDLKNPLSALLGYSGILELGCQDEKNRKYIKKIVDLTQRMNSTISQAKLFSLIQEGKAGGEFDKIDLKETIQGCIEMLYPQAEKFKIRFRAGEGSFELIGTTLMEQAILNILDNSMKYSPEGSEISIRIDTSIEGVVISISDQGPGIEDEIKEEIFQRFWRGKESLRNPGTGLGLAITRGIVEMHNGKIWVEDGDEGGSVFKVSLPWDPNKE